ncbi:F-box protein At3g07870-like [Apium graveolens]|uniref:F-box protein At3g07870-like n=1 Tax=Apium graveolens TaxID=4045 RepID=UPI003D7BBFB6
MMQKEAPSSNADHTTTFNDLPAAMLVNIFTRLPVKTLIRSTSVCKTWYSNITKPTFISAHIQHSLSCSNNNNALFVIPLVIKHKKYCTLISAHTGDVLKKYKIPFQTKTNTLKLCGSLNGVLCLNEIDFGKISGSDLLDDYQELYLWNPSVGKYKRLSWSCFKKGGECSYALGLGVYEPTYDFRVVRIVYLEDEMGFLNGRVPPKVEVFSLRSNKWRRIKEAVVPRVAYQCSITVGNNMAYWLDTKRTKSFFEDGWIVWFDFNTEMFGKIKMPDDVRYCFGLMAHFVLMRFEGKLAVCITSDLKESSGQPFQPCCIWLMSHEDGEVSWNLRFKVLLKERARPLSILGSGTLLMVSPTESESGEGLFSSNLMREDLLQSKPLDVEPGAGDALFIESLLLLEGREELLESA